MIIFQCEPGESITIGSNTRVIILGNANNKTRVGIEAPEGVKIIRELAKTTVGALEHYE